jgi:hypothetical protein
VQVFPSVMLLLIKQLGCINCMHLIHQSGTVLAEIKTSNSAMTPDRLLVF